MSSTRKPPKKTVITEMVETRNAKGKLVAYRKTKEMFIGGTNAGQSTKTRANPSIRSSNSDKTEYVAPTQFGDSTIYGDRWSSTASNKSDSAATVVRQARLVNRMDDAYNSNAPPVVICSDQHTPAPIDIDTWRIKLLGKHNEYRRLHRVADVQLNQQLNEHAQSWADHLARTDRFEHRPAQRMAESIARTAHTDLTAVVDEWYRDQQRNRFAHLSADQYSQFLCHDTKYIGIGIGYNHIRSHYILVANYDNIRHIRPISPKIPS